MWKAFVRPVWLARHALLLASLAVLGWIGLWQWDKARGAGDWQNYGYAVQWWLFAGFAVFLWVKLVLDELDPQRLSAREQAAQEVVALGAGDPRPQSAAVVVDDDEEDPELAAYNAHLRRLAERQQ